MLHRRSVHVIRTARPVNVCRLPSFTGCIEKYARNETSMKSIFIDCNDQLFPVWERVVRADDPPIDVNRKAFARDELAARARRLRHRNRRSFVHADPAGRARCPQLKHIVFLGTGAASYMNVAELNERGIKVHTIKGYGDTAVAEHTVALIWARGPRCRAHGSRGALAASGPRTKACSCSARRLA